MSQRIRESTPDPSHKASSFHKYHATDRKALVVLRWVAAVRRGVDIDVGIATSMGLTTHIRH